MKDKIDDLRKDFEKLKREIECLISYQNHDIYISNTNINNINIRTSIQNKLNSISKQINNLNEYNTTTWIKKIGD